jgi:3-hydroxybutyrate dehydrogenase
MLKGKTAIVTGSTSGIGLGIAHALAAQGVDLLLHGFGDPAQTERLRAEFATQYRVSVFYHGADVSNVDEINAMIEYAMRELGSVDILVNNAGIQHVAPIEAFPPERWDAIIATNLSSVFHATRAVLTQMRRRNWGRIINVASTHGLVASPNKAGYVAAKHAVVGLTKVVALETATTGITCNAICPGWVLTPLVQKQLDDLALRERLSPEQAKQRLLFEKQPAQEFVSVEQIGAFVVFLCSDAAAQIRGAALTIDGGWTAQ